MAERGYLVLSAIGPDRPGLVAGLSAHVAARDGNVEDSRMAVLGGSFGVMMLISGSPEAVKAIQDEAEEIESELGLNVHLDETSAPGARSSDHRFEIDVEAADREGIVQAIAEALFRVEGNIVNLESAIYPAPVSGAPLFRLELLVDVPRSISQTRLEALLEELATAENLDCELRPVES